MDNYKKGKRITSLDELMKQDVVFFNDKPLNKAFFQNWQMRYALNMISGCMLFRAYRESEFEEREKADEVSQLDKLLDHLVITENTYICDEMCDSKYCENTCVYTCPQKECYLQYLEWKEQEDAENI